MKLAVAVFAMVGLAIGGSRALLGAQQAAPAQSLPAPPATPPSTPLTRSVWDGVYTAAQARSGALTSGLCTSCHGDSFEGDRGPALTGPDFIERWNGRTVGDLFELIRLTMPDDDPGALTRQQYADLVAYILNTNKFPAGKTEIARDTAVLKQIRFEAMKP